MWLYYSSFIAGTDIKEKKAEMLSRRKQTVKKWLAGIWKTDDKRCSNKAFFMVTNVLLTGKEKSQTMKKKEEQTRKKIIFLFMKLIVYAMENWNYDKKYSIWKLS